MSNASRVSLGTAVNLLMGLKTGWDPSDPTSPLFFTPPEQGMTERAADLGAGGAWSDPLITLHDSAESVLDAIYDVAIASGTSDGANASYGSGALLIRNADRTAALAALQQQHGIDFAVPGRGYALIELRRESTTNMHATFARGVFRMPGADAFRGRTLPRAILKLPHAEPKLTLGWGLDSASSAVPYLDFFAQHGTHYVSSITGGDRILQVFAYAADQWKQLRSDYAAAPQQLQGPDAYRSFLYYLRPLAQDNDGNTFGMVAQRGTITIASRDACFAASVAGGQWREDQWAQGDCILAPWLGSAVQPSAFVRVVPIRVTLSPIALFMNHARERAAWSVFRAAMATIYPDMVRPAFPGADDKMFDALYPARRDALLSDLATPTIAAYVQRLDLAAVQLAVPQIVKRFGIVANLLEARGALSLPGSATMLLAHVVNVPAPADGTVPTVTVPDDAYAGFALSCAKFVGGLAIADAGGARRKLIADGIVYERGPAGPEGRFTACPTGDVYAAPALAALQSLSTQLAAGLNGASAQLGAWQAMAPQAQVRLLTRFADWIAGLIPNDCPDQSLRALRLDALCLARAARSLANGTRQVPYLTFKGYAPSVQAMNAVAGRIQDTLAQYQDRIRQRKLAEALITDLKVVNQNVIDTGKLLTDYFAACAQHQQDLASNYDAIAGSDQQTLVQTNQTIATLQSELGDQRAAVATAIDRYKAAIDIKEAEEIVKLSFEIAKSVFEIGFALATGGGEEDEAKQLKELVEDIQKVVALIAAIDQLAAAIKGGEKELAAADAAFTALGSAPLPTAATLKWDEFRVRMKNAVEKGPAMSERDDVVAAIDILVLRGEALVQSQESAASIVTRIFQERRRQAMAQDQSARLQDLTAKLDPGNIEDLDLDNVDLVGMSGELDQLQSQMMAQLVRAAVIQDLALQYEYLQQPTAPPSSFDLISVGVYMARQQSDLVEAKSALSPPPAAIDQPVRYTIAGIPASALAGGRSFRFRIPPAAREFIDFTMVRFSRLDLTIDGIGATDSGQFIVRLLYGGDPFYDRDQQRNTVTFSTSPRIMNYLGTVVPGQPSAASAGSETSGDYGMVTPFSDWEISFPAGAVNAGLAFSGGVTLTLAFSLTAQINPSARARQRIAATGGSLQDLLAGMQGKSRLNGWDAVFNYTEDKINAFLLAEYNKLKQADQGHLVIPLRTDLTPPDPKSHIGTFTTWAMTLGPPRVAFQDNNSQFATVYLDIIDAQYAFGFVFQDGSRITQTSFPPPPLPAGSFIRGDVKLAAVKGEVDSQHNVVIDLPGGSWTGLPDVSTGNPSFNSFLSNQLATVSTAYPLGTLDTKQNPQLPALTPTAFQFAVTKTDSGLNLLQLFIVTDGAAQNHLYLDEVAEPVPAGFDCSLMISSRILFDQILPTSFSQAKSHLAIGGVDPNDPAKAWTAKVTSGGVSFPISVDDSDYRIDSPVTVDMTGLTLSAGEAPDYGLKIAYLSGFKEHFTHFECTEGHFQGMCLGSEWVDYSVNVTTTASGTIAFTVTTTASAPGSTTKPDQVIQMTVSGDVQADGDIDSGPCKGGPIQEVIVEAYRKAARPAIAGAVTVKLPSISFMALNNLLFPGGDLATMSMAYGPGDIVLLGTLAPPA